MKRVRDLVVVASFVVSGAAFAGETRLNCPSGTVQAGGAHSQHEAAMCVSQETRQFHGPYVQLRADGSVVAKGQFENGMRAGTWSFFDQSGAKTEEIQFDGDNFHGRKVAFHANGRKKVEENYVKGRREGQLRKFDAAGDIVAVEEYRGNVMVKR